MKKIVALLTALTMLALFASCGNESKDPAPTAKNDSYSQTQTPADSSEATDVETTASDSSAPYVDTSESSTEISTAPADEADPSKWTNEEIIDFYKKAAEKTNPTAKSTQVMVLDELIINDGDGALGFFIKILEPAIASVIEKNALEFDGITGGFGALTASDAQSIKAYKSGKYTVVEMTMKNQTDDIHADPYAGTVGHAITVLGDISRVLAEFPQFDVDVENADIAVNYVNATLKVKINENGMIEKGTWKYTCDPEIKNLDISGIMINKADAKIDYIITVGGGF